MCTITVVVMHVASRQDDEFWAKHQHLTDTPQEIQRSGDFFAELLNGPGYLLPSWFFGGMVARLIGVAVFWMWIGWSLDRRLSGAGTQIISSVWLRALVYTLLLAIACLLSYAAFSDIQLHGPSSATRTWQWVRFMKSRAAILRSYLVILWGVGYALYFGRKLIETAFSKQPTLQNSRM